MQNSFCRRTAQFWSFYLKPTHPREFQNLFSESSEFFYFSCTDFFIGEIKLKIWTLNLMLHWVHAAFSKISNFLKLVLVLVFICNCILLYAQNSMDINFTFNVFWMIKLPFSRLCCLESFAFLCHTITLIKRMYSILYGELCFSK